MTPFQEYAHTRWLKDFPEWSSLREDHNELGGIYDPNNSAELHIRYVVAAPANPENKLFVVFTPDDIIVKYAVQGSHVHYDPDMYCDPKYASSDDCIRWALAYTDAINQYVSPVINDQVFIVFHGLSTSLTDAVDAFLNLNEIKRCQIASWSKPRVDYRAEHTD